MSPSAIMDSRLAITCGVPQSAVSQRNCYSCTSDRSRSSRRLSQCNTLTGLCDFHPPMGNNVQNETPLSRLVFNTAIYPGNCSVHACNLVVDAMHAGQTAGNSHHPQSTAQDTLFTGMREACYCTAGSSRRLYADWQVDSGNKHCQTRWACY